MHFELPFRVFDKESDVQIVERRLPHWSQAGTIAFITWRTADSMPPDVLDRWRTERTQWLMAHGIDPNHARWREELERMGPEVAGDFYDRFWNRWHDALDTGYGACVLRRADLASVVSRSLHHFDGQRYVLLDFVVMPNHVHVLASFPDEGAMLNQCESWKHYTATQINRHLKQKGRFWQQEAFDQLVRSERQFEYLRRYIADNPRKAALRSGEYVHYSKSLPLRGSSRGA